MSAGKYYAVPAGYKELEFVSRLCFRNNLARHNIILSTQSETFYVLLMLHVFFKHKRDVGCSRYVQTMIT